MRLTNQDRHFGIRRPPLIDEHDTADGEDENVQYERGKDKSNKVGIISPTDTPAISSRVSDVVVLGSECRLSGSRDLGFLVKESGLGLRVCG